MQMLQTGLDASERVFLISIGAGEPEGDRLGTPHLALLPGVRWTLLNLRKLRRDNPAWLDRQRVLPSELLGSQDAPAGEHQAAHPFRR
jgi:hypothetical protein